jgi:histidinol phosphatase-like PHP family hydrolase
MGKKVRMKVKIAVVSDLHAGKVADGSACRGDIADVLLARAVYRLKRWIQPDIVLLLGDLVEDDGALGVRSVLERSAKAIGILECPLIVIPGNHDLVEELFYEYFPRPTEVVEVKGIRFLPFLDAQTPDFNATRSAADLDRMRGARKDFDGPIVSVQHVSLFPAGSSDCPFYYTNATDVIGVMQEVGIGLAISGHYHEGVKLIREGKQAFVVNAALCEAPFSFLEIEIDGENIRTTRHSLQMSRELGLVDCHIHTPFAYCNENMEPALTLQLAENFGLAGAAFAEHSSHLYFNRADYKEERHLQEGLAVCRDEDDRFDAYLKELQKANCPGQCVGLEIECDYQNRLLLREEDRERVHFLIGAVHGLPERKAKVKDLTQLTEQFMTATATILQSGIRVLAHPFRIFRRCKFEPPEKLFAPVMQLLREANVAAEINFHTNEPPPDFFRLCIEAGVKLTFGSDAHHLREIGEFQPHLNLLQEIGYDGDLGEILFDPRM